MSVNIDGFRKITEARRLARQPRTAKVLCFNSVVLVSSSRVCDYLGLFRCLIHVDVLNRDVDVLLCVRVRIV